MAQGKVRIQRASCWITVAERSFTRTGHITSVCISIPRLCYAPLQCVFHVPNLPLTSVRFSTVTHFQCIKINFLYVMLPQVTKSDVALFPVAPFSRPPTTAFTDTSASLTRPRTPIVCIPCADFS